MHPDATWQKSELDVDTDYEPLRMRHSTETCTYAKLVTAISVATLRTPNLMQTDRAMLSQSNFSGHYVVTSRLGDPFFQSARARLIWASQTAEATQSLGFRTLLVATGSYLPYRPEIPAGELSLKRTISAFYNVQTSFKPYALTPPRSEIEKHGYGKVEADNLFPKYVLPHASLVHTRDPRVVACCVKAGVSVIFEDHNEDYHVASGLKSDVLNDKNCLAIVAITNTVADRLEFSGVSRSKIIVLDSGVNKRATERQPEKASAWRKQLLENGRRSHLVVYTGGMQRERGLMTSILAAEKMPSIQFAFAGGNKKDINMWRELVTERHINNVSFLGYLPQAESCALQQAADVVIMTRNADSRASITSPLKFYEYFASGTPVLSANITTVNGFSNKRLVLNWYDPTAQGDFERALLETMTKFPKKEDGYRENIRESLNHTWERRQSTLLSHIGLI